MLHSEQAENVFANQTTKKTVFKGKKKQSKGYSHQSEYFVVISNHVFIDDVAVFEGNYVSKLSCAH